MTLETKKSVFVELGKFLSQFSEETSARKATVLNNDLFFDFITLIKLSQSHNGWYTPEQYTSIQSYKALTEENLDKWLSAYEIDPKLQKSR
jgi:hypothetical protein